MPRPGSRANDPPDRARAAGEDEETEHESGREPASSYWCRCASILEEIGRIESTDVVLPLAEEPGRELRIRCIVRPDPAQALLLDRLGLRLPERVRIPSRIAEM